MVDLLLFIPKLLSLVGRIQCLALILWNANVSVRNKFFKDVDDGQVGILEVSLDGITVKFKKKKVSLRAFTFVVTSYFFFFLFQSDSYLSELVKLTLSYYSVNIN